MSAALTLLALVAALTVYPGGLTVVVWAGWGRAAAIAAPGPAGVGRLLAGLGAQPARITGLAALLVGLAVVALPWPDNPVGAVPGASAVALGSLGVPTTVAALWVAAGVADGWRPLPSLVAHAAWAAALLGLAVWAGSAGWAALLAHPGAGPATLRVLTGVAAAAGMPLLASRPGGDWLAGVRWAGHSAVCAALWVPTIGRLGPGPALAVWALVAAAVAAGHRVMGAAARKRPGGQRP